VNGGNNIPYKVLITAGPTIEPIDPVRYISNFSTGTMGYKIAAEAVRRGNKVCLVSGPVRLSPPDGAEVINVTTAREMRDRIFERLDNTDCVIMTAAVCDFRPAEVKKQKIKKTGKLALDLIENPDILKEIGHRKGLVKVGFALETDNLLENAKNKLNGKSLDIIVATMRGRQQDPFGGGEKTFTLLDRELNARELKKVTKDECAKIILDEVERLKA